MCVYILIWIMILIMIVSHVFNGSLWNEGYLDCRSCEAWLMPFQLYQLRRLGLVGSHGFDTQPYIYIYTYIYTYIYMIVYIYIYMIV